MNGGCSKTISMGLVLLLISTGLSIPRSISAQTPAKQPTSYTVQPGDSLSLIASKLYKDPSLWPAIYRANQTLIQDPGVIQVGWTLRIPDLDSSPQPALAETGESPISPPATASESLPPAPATASERPTPPPAIRPTITLVTGNEYPPFTGEELPQQGMLTEVVRTAFETIGYDVDFKFWEWKYGFNAAKEGIFTGAFPWYKNQERLVHFLYSKPLYRVLIRAFVRRGSPISFEKLEDLKGLTVCRPDGYFLHDLQPLLEKKLITLKTPKTIETCFNLLVRENVDVVSLNELGGQGVLHEIGLADQVCILDKAISIDTLHLILPKLEPQSAPLLYEFDQALARLEATGVLKAITTRHLKHYYDTFSTPPTYCSEVKTTPVDVGQNVPSAPPQQQSDELVAAVPPSPSPPPQQQPGEFVAAVPPKRPPKQLELVSVPVTEGPSIDGQVSEPVWENAPAITTLDAASQRPITLRSVHTADELFFLVTYPDQAPSETHQSWQWDTAEQIYKPMGDREDAFVFKWSMVGNQVNLAFRGAEPHRADTWFWTAHRTNPSGYADDTMHLLSPEPQEEATIVESPTHGTLYLRRIADAGQAAYTEQLTPEHQADFLPRFSPRQPQGSRADVRAKGAWSNGQWTIEFGRKLQTGSDDDLAFDSGEVYLFAVSCYEMAHGNVQPDLTQPLYQRGDAFDRLLLRIARGNEARGNEE